MPWGWMKEAGGLDYYFFHLEPTRVYDHAIGHTRIAGLPRFFDLKPTRSYNHTMLARSPQCVPNLVRALVDGYLKRAG